MPAVRPEARPEHWELDDAGRRGAETLRQVIPQGALLISSEEPKARQTLEPSGNVLTDARFNEVSRDEPYDGDFRARRRSYITGTNHPGWEPRRQVTARFGTAIEFWVSIAAGRPLIVATHGMAMTLWLTTAANLADPAAFWADLRLPDLFEVNPGTRTVNRVLSPLLFQVR